MSTTGWSCPDGVEILPPDADRATWLAARREGIGGSDASTIVGLNPFPTSSRYALYLDKLGLLPPTLVSSAMEWGNRHEPAVADWFTEHTGRTLHRVGLYTHRDRPWQRGTPDRGVDCGGILEIKTTSSRGAQDWADDTIADHAALQAQHYMAVTGVDHAHFAVLVDGRDAFTRVSERDQNLIDIITAAERDFWHNHVLARRPPPIDGSVATANAIAQRWPDTQDDGFVVFGPELVALLDQWEQARAAANRAEEHTRWLRSQIADLMGPAGTAVVAGEQVATLRSDGSFNVAAFARDHPDLHAEFQTTRQVLDTARLATEHPELHTRYRARVLRRKGTHDAQQ